MIWGGVTEWTITQSGTWTVPRTGRYMLELYGGGGYGAQAANAMPGVEYLGGSSCQTYEAITLNEGQKISVVVGTSGNPNGSVSPTGTQFGSYSVSAGGNATSAGGGGGAGNKGTTTSNRYDASKGNKNYSNGKLGGLYGYGSGYQSSSGPGAVYLKYLGA